MKTLRSNTGGKSMTFYEIGRKLGISQTSARLIYQNGMIKLKRLLEKKGIDEDEFHWYINQVNR